MKGPTASAAFHERDAAERPVPAASSLPDLAGGSERQNHSHATCEPRSST